MKRYQLTVTLLEDLHTGSGTGAGDYDALLARDNNGKPMIPASHLLGVWKYNLERSGQHKEEIDKLFGASNGKRGALIATGLYSSEDIDSLAWTSTTREKFSRVAQDNTLRTKEFIPAGSVFVSILCLRDDTLYQALNTARRLTDCLGARRQRGDGRIKTSLEAIESKPAPTVNTLDKTCVRLLLRTLDPLCLPITGSPDNVIKSECYVRGQVLGGALINWLLQQKKNNIVQQFFDGNIQVGNAYPLPCFAKYDSWHNWQVLPMPLHFATPKPTSVPQQGLPWWAGKTVASTWHDQFAEKTEKKEGEKLKRPSDNAFIFSDDGKDWQSFNVTLAERLRNSPSNKYNADGSLFAQEEIPEQTLLLAELQFSSVEIATSVMQSLEDLLQENGDCLTIGRGGAPLAIEGWQVYQPIIEGNSVKPSQELLITLTSDLIARSPYLGFYDKLTPLVLCELLKLQTSDFSDFKNWQVNYSGDYVEVHGFNPCTGLPRLPALAIRRGSSLQIKGQNVDLLREKLRKPLGERTEEGFGRFRLDFLPVIQGKVAKEQAITENSEEKMYELAEDAFVDDILTYVNDKGKNDFPTLSQWQALRFPEVSGKTLADLIVEHRQRLKNKDDTSKVKWLKNYSKTETWLDWLINQLQAIAKDQHQRLFYRALLSKVRLKLRESGETS